MTKILFLFRNDVGAPGKITLKSSAVLRLYYESSILHLTSKNLFFKWNHQQNQVFSKQIEIQKKVSN